jgi:hypothetical protein
MEIIYMAYSIVSDPDGLGDYVEYPLNKGYITLISPEDLEFVQSQNWWMHKKGYVVGKRQLAPNEWKHLKLHRELMLHWRYDIEGIGVDHRNGVKHDNRRGNLRPATEAQNSQNKHGCWGEVNYMGVYKDNGKYRSNIQLDYEVFHLGTFTVAEHAAEAHDIARLEMFEFVDPLSLNFPDNPLYGNVTLREFQLEHAYQPTSQYRGVDEKKATKKRPIDGYRARTRFPDRKEKSFSVFEKEEDAAKCVDIMEIEIYGSDAIERLNFPAEDYPGLLQGYYTGISSVDFFKKYGYKTNTGYRGVTKWAANFKGFVTKDKVEYQTETFTTQEETAIAVDILRLQLFGKEAERYLNFPIENYWDILEEKAS